MSNFSLVVCSLNVKGQGQEKKRKAQYLWAKEWKSTKGDRIDVLFLQETHSTEETEDIWRKQWNGSYSIFAHGESNSRGVAILMNSAVDCEPHEIVKDDEGRFLLLKAKLNGEKVILLNIYAPNTEREQVEFWEVIEQLLRQKIAPDYKLILGGDFNVVLNPSKDKLGGNIEVRRKVLFLLEEIMNEFNLVDVWRAKHPRKREYTWEQSTPRVHFRGSLIFGGAGPLFMKTFHTL